ncbi:MAG: rhamnulokinase [Chloroflexi bacterium]|nr:rhamnulokinase [Chloroflexota bacterium]
MTTTANFLAVDLGASGGRVILGRWDGARFTLEVLHRFANGPVAIHGRLYWDHLRLWSEINASLQAYTQRYQEPLTSIGVDTWGVDYALLDGAGKLLGNPYHYRDQGTEGMMNAVFARVARQEIYETTGIQFLQLNTLYQLFARVQDADPQLSLAETLLLTPDLFHYWLTGRKVAEYSIASTSQMLKANEAAWATTMLERLAIPSHFLPEIVPSGTVLGELLPEISAEAGFKQAVSVIAIAEHDTASAVAAIPDLDAYSAYISSGTWSLMGVESVKPVITEQSLALDFTNEGGVDGTIRVLKNMAGLWLLQESRRQWQRQGKDYSWDELVALAGKTAPLRSFVNPDDPAFALPSDMPAAIRAYCARTAQPIPDSPGAVVRTVLESLALKYRWILGSLETLAGHRLETIRIVGGGTQNRLLNQFAANACQRPVVAGPIEATALGNIMMQAIATGHLDDVPAGRQAIAASIQRQRYEPQDGAAWDEAFARFMALA